MLAAVGFVVAALVIGIFLAYRLRAGYPAVSYRVLNRGEAAFLSAAAETFFPATPGLPVDGLSAGLPEWVDRYLAALPTRQRGLLRALFLLFEQATLVFPARGVGAFRRFSAMSSEQRLAYLEGWERSRLHPRRLALTALRAVLVLGYVSNEQNLARLGLTRWEIEPVVVPADLLYPPVGRSRDAIAASPSDLDRGAPRPPLRPAVGEGA